MSAETQYQETQDQTSAAPAAPAAKPSNEFIYYAALKRIASYGSPNWIRQHAEKEYGLEAEEAIEMAYENVLYEAEQAIKGKRRPKK